jgi:hypothetical protein
VQAEPAWRARCAQLPARRPPAWRDDWAHEIARCIMATECGHDREELCVLRSVGGTQSAVTCSQRSVGARDALHCAVLNGLTPEVDAKVDACLRAGGGVQDCSPALDWK